jgi:hypothetical protein
MQQSPPTDPKLLNDYRRAVAMLVARNTPKEDIYFSMQQTFKDQCPAPQAVERMRVAAQRAFDDEVREHVGVARTKQKSRLYGLLGQAQQKGALHVALGAERLLAEIDGTLAPREVVISADASTRDALAALLSILPPETLHQLADGKWVPLGYVGPNGQPVLTAGGEDVTDDD